MNAYTYAQIFVGQEERFSVVVTEEMLRQFRAITGDDNPLHNDDAFAQSAGYEAKAAYGMLTASFLSTLAGVCLPGKYSLIHGVDVEFPRPVYAGERLTVSGTVTEKDDRFQTFVMKVAITNESGQKVCRGEMRMGVLA